MTELRKCPFCGGEASTYVAYDDGYYVCCDECGCGLPVYNTEQEAIEAWNKRVSCDTCAMYFPDDGCMAGLTEEVKP
jgi:Lar family restriction alleviation protein